MRIRRDQIDHFSNDATGRFTDRMLAHLRKHFPDRCNILNDEQIRSTIQLGIQRSSSYGVTAERDVCKYIDMMMVFGDDFDRRLDLPWAQQILNAEARHPSAKMEALLEQAKEH